MRIFDVEISIVLYFIYFFYCYFSTVIGQYKFQLLFSKRYFLFNFLLQALSNIGWLSCDIEAFFYFITISQYWLLANLKISIDLKKKLIYVVMPKFTFGI